MKQKKVWRYYCEHCAKGGCNAGHIKTHEKHCCRNPNRECRMCGVKHRDFVELSKLLNDKGVDALHDAVEHCPNCILATVLQTKDYTDPERGFWTWDYKKSVQDWWNEKNAVTREQDDAYNAALYSAGMFP